LHAGVVVGLERPTCRIGTDVECDIVLNDPQIQPRHLTLHIQPRHLAIEAHGGDVMVDGVRVRQGQGYRCRWPVEVCVGQTSLRLSRPQDSQPGSAARGLMSIRLALAALVLLCLGLGLFRFGAAPAPLPAPLAEAAAPAPALVDASERVTALRDRLQAAGLHGLTVDPEPNAVRVSGTLDSAQRLRWLEVQGWYDRTWGNRPLLRNDVTLAAPPQPPRVHIQAVWLGPSPYVVGERGERLYPGAAVTDGWVLQRIEPQRLVLARDGHEFELTL